MPSNRVLFNALVLIEMFQVEMDAKEQRSNPLQNGAVVCARRRDLRVSAQELDGALEKAVEAVLSHQGLEPFVVEGRR